MALINHTAADFTELLGSKSPVPGGGGASALAGAIGAALGAMVGSLTIGKKKYAAVEKDMIALTTEANRLREEFLALVDQDAEAFRPLSRAYAMPHETEAEKTRKAQVMEKALRGACDVPLEIMRKCAEAIRLMQDFAEKGSRLAVSDAGVGAAMCRAALEGAALNVFINTDLMQDRVYAAAKAQEARELLDTWGPAAQAVYDSVRAELGAKD